MGTRTADVVFNPPDLTHIKALEPNAQGQNDGSEYESEEWREIHSDSNELHKMVADMQRKMKLAADNPDSKPKMRRNGPLKRAWKGMTVVKRQDGNQARDGVKINES